MNTARCLASSFVLAMIAALAPSCAAPEDDVEPLPGAWPARLIGSSTLDGASASSIVLRGPLAFVGCGEDGVKIVDVSKPEAPDVVGTVAATADAVAVSGDSLFVLDLPSGMGSEATLAVFDVLDPRAAEPVKSVTFDSAANGDLAVDGRYVAVAAGARGLRVADSRQLLFTSRPVPQGAERADSVLVKKGVMFALGGPDRSWFSDDSGKGVLETASLDRNAPLGKFAVGALAARPHALDGVAGPTGRQLFCDGDRLFVATAGGLELFDASDPRQLKPLGRTEIEDAFRVSADGDLAACACGDLALVDVKDPANPRVIATVPTPGIVLDVAVRGDLVFVAAGSGGLRVYQVTNRDGAP